MIRFFSAMSVLLMLLFIPAWNFSAGASEPHRTAPADAILGTWVVAEKDAHIEIYRNGDAYFGRISWLREPEDPDADAVETPRVGLVIARDFRFDGRAWKGGTLYDPQDGKNYRGFMALDDRGALHVRGFIGISLLGRTTVWQRVK